MPYGLPIGGDGGGGLGSLFGSGFFGGPGGMALANFGLPLLATLMGGGSAQSRAFSQWQNQRNQLMDPKWMFGRIGDYQSLLNQASGGMRSSILTGQNAFQNTLGRNLAASGANRSGIGALAASAGGSMANSQLLDLSSSIRRESMGMAMQDRNQYMQMLQPQYGANGQMMLPYMDNRWNSAFGHGISDFMAYLHDRNNQRQP